VGWLESLLAIIAGLTGGFVSILASNGSAVTLPALEFLGFPEHVANGTNRLSVVALGLVGTVSFYRRGLLEWRKGSWIALFLLILSETDEVNWAAGIPLALGSAAGAYVASLSPPPRVGQGLGVPLPRTPGHPVDRSSADG
jgi:uncharacterized membrane protein YfcA